MEQAVPVPRKRRSAVKAVAVVAVVIVVALLLLTPAVQNFIGDLVSSPFQARYPESVTYSLERTLTVDANGGSIYNYTLDICEPMSIAQSGYVLQTVSAATYSPAATTEEQRYGTQTWVVWDGGTLNGHRSREYTATYTVTTYAHIWNIDEASSLTTADVPESYKTQYLHDEWLMDMTSSSIVATSESIVGDETNVYLILKGIYDWMLDNIEYETDATGGDPKSALQTLSSTKGDCDDQSILFCSLARAAGVPAWLQLGALYVNGEDSWGGHAWLQAYVPLASGGGENVVIDVVNQDFLVFRPNRFVDFTDDGVGSHLLDYYFTSYISSSSMSDPIASEQYVSLSYEESDRTISRGSVYDLGEVRLACTVPAPTRR